MRLVTSPHYADIALSVYVKITALAARPEGCMAATATIAQYLGVSTSSVERGMTQLKRPGPDGVVELVSTRRSLRGGCGTSALRRTRPLSSTERFVWIAVAAAEDLSPRQLRAYALIAYAQAQRIALTLSEIAGSLHHHSGQRSGQPLGTTAAGELINELEAARWITVERRAGVQGRHHYIAHDIRPEASPAPCEDLASDTSAPSETPAFGEGSGSPADGGWLATKELPMTDRPDDERACFSPAVGEVQVGTAVENAAENPQDPDAGSELALRADDNHSPLTITSTAPRKTSSSTYSGPPLTISPRIHAVLEPVHGLFQQTSVFMQRRIAREVGNQLRSGIDDARLRQRLAARYAGTTTDEIQDPGRWLLGIGLPHWGCGIFECEAGVLWSSGRCCSVCEEIVQDRRRADALPSIAPPSSSRPSAAVVPRSGPAVPRGRCRECSCVVLQLDQVLTDGLCRVCREEQADLPLSPPAPHEAPEVPEACIGWNGEGCPRPALGTAGLCVRCRARQVECTAP